MSVSYSAAGLSTTNNIYGWIGLGLDSTTAFTGPVSPSGGYVYGPGLEWPMNFQYPLAPQLGSHYIAALEYATGSSFTFDQLSLNALSAQFRM